MNMKRKALLIGYSGHDTGSYLPGVKIDLKAYACYLQSVKGGAWKEEEFYPPLIDCSLGQLRNAINNIKTEKNELVFIVYTGHGAYDEQAACRKLEIDKDTVILEKELWNLAPKQILICDSCSRVSTEKRNFSCQASFNDARDFNRALELSQARKLYETWCRNCPAQQLRFYAAAKGYYANDTEQGGLYSSQLLQILNNWHTRLDIVSAHRNAAERVRSMTGFHDSQRAYSAQNPSYCVPRLHEQEYLPGVIKL